MANNLSNEKLVNEMNEKRVPITWDNYFMSLAKLSAMRSKDPVTQVGCCVVNPNTKRIMSLGYNGLPNGCSDTKFPWGKESDNLSENKYPYVVHAELNAILNAKQDLTGCSMYVTHSPCNECMKAIIQSGIKTVYYINKYKPESEEAKATNKMVESAGILMIQLEYEPIILG